MHIHWTLDLFIKKKRNHQDFMIYKQFLAFINIENLS